MLITSCASGPAKIGADTYYMSRKNIAGAFGDVGVLTGKLIIEGNEVCEKQGKHLELVTVDKNSVIPFVRMGGTSITFKCVVSPGNPVIRPDNGVTTIEIIQK